MAPPRAPLSCRGRRPDEECRRDCSALPWEPRPWARNQGLVAYYYCFCAHSMFHVHHHYHYHRCCYHRRRYHHEGSTTATATAATCIAVEDADANVMEIDRVTHSSSIPRLPGLPLPVCVAAAATRRPSDPIRLCLGPSHSPSVGASQLCAAPTTATSIGTTTVRFDWHFDCHHHCHHYDHNWHCHQYHQRRGRSKRMH